MNIRDPKSRELMEQAEESQELLDAYGKAISAGHQEKAGAIALQVMAMATDTSTKEFLQDMLLSIEAHEREAAGDLAGAEQARRKVVTLHEDDLRELKFAGEEWRSWGLISNASLQLSAFQSRNGKLDDAWSSALVATAAARRTNISIRLSTALENEAECALTRKDVTRALAAAEEAIEVLDPDNVLDLRRGKSLLLRARCRVAAGRGADAESDLAASWKLLTPRVKSLPGVRHEIAEWWEVTASILADKGELKGVVKARRKAVEQLRGLAELFQPPPNRVLKALKEAQKNLSGALRQIGDEKAANRAQAKAEAITLR